MELFLLIAENDHDFDTFGCCSQELRADKDFMMQAVKLCARLFHTASDALQTDFDLAVWAFANCPWFCYEESRQGQRPETMFFLRVTETRIRKKLLAYDIFVQTVLPGMSMYAGSQCRLTLLNQGTYTSLVYRKRSAEYLDIPTGTELGRLR